jgi:hypothetical protein
MLTRQVQSVNLPVGTKLTLNYGGLGRPGSGPRLLQASGQSGKFSARLGTQAGTNDNIAVMQGSAIILPNPARWSAGNC